jgi:hypothetical protein
VTYHSLERLLRGRRRVAAKTSAMLQGKDDGETDLMTPAALKYMRVRL